MEFSHPSFSYSYLCFVSTVTCQNDVHEKGLLYYNNRFLFFWFLSGYLYELNIYEV